MELSIRSLNYKKNEPDYFTKRRTENRVFGPERGSSRLIMSSERNKSIIIPEAERLYQEARKGYHKVVLPNGTTSFFHTILMETRMGAGIKQKADLTKEEEQLDRITDAFYAPHAAYRDRDNRVVLLRFDLIEFFPRFMLGQIEVGRFDREKLVRALNDFRCGIQRLGFDFSDDFASEVDRSTLSVGREGSVG